MSDSIEIRVLGGPDVAVLRKMLATFGEAFGDLPTYTARQPDDSYLRRLLESDTFVAIAAVPNSISTTLPCTALTVGAGLPPP